MTSSLPIGHLCSSQSYSFAFELVAMATDFQFNHTEAWLLLHQRAGLSYLETHAMILHLIDMAQYLVTLPHLKP